jgi:hypothetical protein
MVGCRCWLYDYLGCYYVFFCFKIGSKKPQFTNELVDIVDGFLASCDYIPFGLRMDLWQLVYENKACIIPYLRIYKYQH